MGVSEQVLEGKKLGNYINKLNGRPAGVESMHPEPV